MTSLKKILKNRWVSFNENSVHSSLIGAPDVVEWHPLLQGEIKTMFTVLIQEILHKNIIGEMNFFIQ